MTEAHLEEVERVASCGQTVPVMLFGPPEEGELLGTVLYHGPASAVLAVLDEVANSQLGIDLCSDHTQCSNPFYTAGLIRAIHPFEPEGPVWEHTPFGAAVLKRREQVDPMVQASEAFRRAYEEALQEEHEGWQFFITDEETDP